MDDRLLFDRFHAAFDVEPRVGSFERMRAVLSETDYRVRRRDWIRLRIARPGVRTLAAAVMVALALAGAAGFLVLNGYLHRSVPVEIHHTGATGTCVSGLHMVSATVGWQGPYAHTTDGGVTWIQATGPSLAGQTKGGRQECTLDGVHGWIVLAAGPSPVSADRLVVFVTGDGGNTWQQLGSVPAQGINVRGAIDFINLQDGWLLVDDGGRTMYTTSDGGYTWKEVAGDSQLRYAPGCADWGMTFLDGDTGWLSFNCNEGYSQQPSSAGAGVVIVTRDGGRSWKPAGLPGLPTTPDFICGAEPPLFAGGQGVVPVSCGGTSSGWAAVYHSGDGGQTWTVAKAPFWFNVGDVHFVDPSLGFMFHAVSGNQADLYKTTDSGRSWRLVKANVFAGQTVDDFDFINVAVGFARTATSGEGYWTTSDGGLTWTLPGHRTLPGNIGCPAPAAPGGEAPIPMLMADASTGWAVGARRTVDGGNSWTPAGPPPVPDESSGYSEFFLDAQHAWVAETAGSANACADHIVVFSTADGGKTWEQGDPIAVANDSAGVIWDGRADSGARLASVAQRQSWMNFISPGAGWLLVESRTGGDIMTSRTKLGPLYRTVDGGRHWTVVSVDPGGNATCGPLQGMTFTSATTGWIGLPSCGGAAEFLVTHDGGATWLVDDVGNLCDCQASAPVFVDPSHGFAYVDGASLYILATSDGGQTWQSHHVSDGYIQVFAMQFIDPSHGWAVTSPLDNSYRLLATADGGRTWRVVNSSMAAPVDFSGVSLTFFSTSQGFWATGTALYRTTDGGAHWTKIG